MFGTDVPDVDISIKSGPHVRLALLGEDVPPRHEHRGGADEDALTGDCPMAEDRRFISDRSDPA